MQSARLREGENASAVTKSMIVRDPQQLQFEYRFLQYKQQQQEANMHNGLDYKH